MSGSINHKVFILNTWLMYLFLLLICAVITSCSSALWPFGKGDETDRKPIGDNVRTIAYEVKISGVDPQEKDVLSTLKETSTAIRLRDRPPPTLSALNRRAEDDIKRFSAVLRSFGFYDGKVTATVQETASGQKRGSTPAKTVGSDTITAPQPQSAVVEYQVETGAPYLLGRSDLIIVRPDRTDQRPMSGEALQKVGFKPGMQAKADLIIQAEQRVIDVLRNQGYPLAKAGIRKVTADTAAKTLNVTFKLITGKKARFGKITVAGARDVDPDFIAGYRSWKPNATFSADEVTKTRRDLAQSNLFSAASVNIADKVNEQGEIPIEIRVTERDHRTVSGGIDYSTAEGIGANLRWEHRNLLGAGERLRLGLTASQLLQGFETDFRKPQFFQRQQALLAEFRANNNQTDAYEGELVEGFVGVERQLLGFWSATGGITAEYAALTGTETTSDNYQLGGLRGILRRDSTTDQLDPTTGSRLELAVSPYTSLGGAGAQFISTVLTGSQYVPFDEDGRYVFAWRGRIGSILGERVESLPSHKRFFAGGGGSIRGYAYQMVGPLDENNDPIGGASVLTAGAEVRARVTEKFGVVPFFEGGNVFEERWPGDLSLQWAAGLGLRYYTPIGPLRCDVAMPLNKRADIDDSFQIYLSIGQAF